MRYVGDIPTEPSLAALARKEITAQEFTRQHRIVMDWLEKADKEKIGLPHDGETFDDDSPQGMLETLARLKAMGYNVPEYVFEILREEIAESASQPGHEHAT
jgi:hypothetical protein